MRVKNLLVHVFILTVTIILFSILTGTGEKIVNAVTNILITDGTDTEVVRGLIFSNISAVGTDVNLVTDPFKFGTSNGRIQWETDHLEFSNDAGSTYTDFLELPYTNYTAFDLGASAVGGTVELDFAGNDAFRYDVGTSTIQFWNGSVWQDVGSGSGSGFALDSTDHTNIFLANTKSGQYSQLDSTTLQMSFFANFTDLATAENLLHRIEAQYSCTLQRFGKDVSDQLVYEHTTTVATVCVTTVYTSTATLTAAHQARWVEYGVQINEAGNITFYVDGVAWDTQAMTSSQATQATHNETLRLYEGWEGSGGAVKIGDTITWPTTGWKGIDTEMNTFPYAVFVLPLTEEGESTVTDTVGSEPLTKDGDVTWETVRGGF